MSRTLSSAVPRLTSRGKLSARCGPLTLAAAPPTASQLRRPFFSFPGVGTGASTTQQLTADRTLPYPSGPLYELIADVDSYDRFVPYCSSSRVTQWSAPDPRDANGRRWPVLA